MATLLMNTDLAKSSGIFQRKEAYDNSASAASPTSSAALETTVASAVPAGAKSGGAGTPTVATAPYSNIPGLISLSLVLIIAAELIVYVILGSFAAWLSWTSNTSIGWHPVFCVIFAIFAFMCSGSYLFSHLVFKLDLLHAVRAAKSLVQSSPGRSNNSSSSLRVQSPSGPSPIPTNASHTSR